MVELGVTSFRLLLPASMGRGATLIGATTLENALNALPDMNARVLVATDYQDIERRLEAGEVDAAWAPPDICARVNAAAVLRMVRFGSPSYLSAILADREREISPKALAGLRAAWVDRESAGGYRLPVSHLRRRGVEPDDVLASQTFRGTYTAALVDVLEGRADLTAIHTSHATREAALERAMRCVGRKAHRLVPSRSRRPRSTMVWCCRLRSERLGRIGW